MNKVIAVELSGSPKLYNYVATNVQLLNVNVGDRVVIPNKLKEDMSLSLSIGVYKGIVQDAPTEGLKPVVQFLDAASVQAVRLCLMRDAQEAAATLAAESKVAP